MLISVVIPAYNEEGYIGDLLNSIQAQTYKDYEVIVVDSYSSDKTKEIVKKFGARVILKKNTQGREQSRLILWDTVALLGRPC